jgi:hypothetical protein
MEAKRIIQYTKIGQAQFERKVCMRTYAILFGILLIFMVSVATAVEEKEDSQQNQPAIYIKDLSQDLGTIFEQESYKFKFIVKNTGKSDLVIDSVKPG